MTLEQVRVGDVLYLERRPIQVDPALEYREVGVRSFGKGLFHKEPVSGVDLGSKRVFRIEPGDLVISNVFAWEGAIALASQAESGMIGSHRFMTYVPKDDRIDASWAGWFFLSEPGLELIRVASPGSAGRNKTLAIERFERLEIPLPSRSDQEQVAARLRTVSGRAMSVRTRLAQAHEVSEAFAVSLCSRPDLAPGEKRDRGWKEVPLGSVLTPASDSVAVDPASSYPNLGIYSFGRGVFGKPPIEGGSTSATRLNRVSGGQFIYSRLFAFEGAYAHVPPEFDRYYVSNEFPTFDVDPGQVDARWLATYLRSPTRWAELGGASRGLGVRRQRVPAEAVLAYKVWLPPIEAQREALTALTELDSARALRGEVRERVDSVLPAALNEAFGSIN